ncbi:hypothetical protein OKC48_21940 [Methylorubrum extorquens]|uniref:hypothetical protein n=1 Tax=Methylorubrum extorquens TaxID=408 RepID=UPI0022375863|nr:hypothetical protein [Methylorubrum extorquens]UYW25905.1 hypothetical protein OKC48_21940 [Methylorubrum extorquens]
MAASLNRAAFYAAVRASLFGGRLKASQVAGMDAIFDAAPSLLGTTSLGYALATTFHETARTMQPIEEYGRGKGKSYGPTGFWGRGFVQLTWEENYAKATQRLRQLGYLRANEDLVKTPKLAMRLDLAAAILFYGMVEGWFTGKKLADYFGGGRYEPVGARRIINGTDKDELIAGQCGLMVDALRAARHSVIPGAIEPSVNAALISAPTIVAAKIIMPSEPAAGGLLRSGVQTTGGAVRSGLAGLYDLIHTSFRKA